MIPDQQAPQAIGALTNVPFPRLEFLWARHQPRGLLHLVQLVEDFLYLPGVIGILAGQTRITRHIHAPFRVPCTLKHHRGFGFCCQLRCVFTSGSPLVSHVSRECGSHPTPPACSIPTGISCASPTATGSDASPNPLGAPPRPAALPRVSQLPLALFLCHGHDRSP